MLNWRVFGGLGVATGIAVGACGNGGPAGAGGAGGAGGAASTATATTTATVTTSSGGLGCTPGATQTCVCLGGTYGVQTCLDDGKGYSACACGG